MSFQVLIERALGKRTHSLLKLSSAHMHHMIASPDFLIFNICALGTIAPYFVRVG